MLDRLTSIETFLAVARNDSFTQAATELGLSRAMVTKHIKSLEAELGVRLLNRNTRSLHLTEAGAAYRTRISPVLEALTEIASNVGDMSGTASGTLSLAAPTSFGLFHLSEFVAAYIEATPNVAVQLMLTDRSVNLIEEGFDLGIHIGELVDSNLVARRLGETKMIVCASPEYIAQHGEPGRLEALSKHNCLVFSEVVHRDHGTWRFDTDKDSTSVVVRGDLVANQGDALRIAAIAGRGIVRLPSYVVADDLASGRLQAILTEFETIARPIYALYPHREFLPSKVRSFVQFLLDQFELKAYD